MVRPGVSDCLGVNTDSEVNTVVGINVPKCLQVVLSAFLQAFLLVNSKPLVNTHVQVCPDIVKTFAAGSQAHRVKV